MFILHWFLFYIYLQHTIFVYFFTTAKVSTIETNTYFSKIKIYIACWAVGKQCKYSFTNRASLKKYFVLTIIKIVVLKIIIKIKYISNNNILYMTSVERPVAFYRKGKCSVNYRGDTKLKDSCLHVFYTQYESWFYSLS